MAFEGTAPCSSWERTESWGVGAWPGPRLGIPAAWPSAQPADSLDRALGEESWGGVLSSLSTVGSGKEGTSPRLLSPFPKLGNHWHPHEGPLLGAP